MNERIEELAEQCYEENSTQIDVYKFAELIVRECSAFANHFSDGHEKDQFGRKMFLYTNDIGQVILEHFGVEE
jgi:hypothetical protein